MQFDKDMKSKYSALFIQGRELLLSYRGLVETRKERITTYSYNGMGICHMRTMSYGIDLGFLKGAKLMDDNNRLTGNGKSIRVLPQKEKLEPELVKYYIDQTIKIIEGVS